MPVAGFETAIPANDRRQNLTLDRSAVRTGMLMAVAETNLKALCRQLLHKTARLSEYSHLSPDRP